MPEDRFADLGPRRPEPEEGEEPTRQSAAERLAELDETDPELVERRKAPPQPTRPGGRYTWVVGIAFVLAIIVAGANALRHSGQGFRGVPAGKELPRFAAPLATSNHNNDVNVQPRAGGGHPGACEVRGPGIVNLCQLRQRPLVMVFVANGGNDCARELDRVGRAQRSAPAVTFLGVISRKSLSGTGSMVRAHGWRFPVVLDRDGELLNLYGVGDCPTTVFAYRGGRSAGSRRGFLTEASLRRGASDILSGRALGAP